MKKSAGIIIQNGALLVVRSQGKDVFFAPGGKPEAGESAQQALIRELNEEIGISLTEDDITFYNVYTANASGHDQVELEMSVFTVHRYQGEIKASAEIAEIKWVNSTNVAQTNISTIFKSYVFPELLEQGLIR